MGAPDVEARRLSKVIDHPVRARILELLGERGPLGWKEISQEVGVKTGALYHHLDALEGLVERDPSKKYYLTKSGRIVYEKTSKSRTIESVKDAAMTIQREGSSRRTAVSLFVPRSLLRSLTGTSSKSALALALILTAFGAYSFFAGVSPVLLYLHQDPGPVPTLGGLAASVGAVSVACYISARAAFRAPVEALPLAAATSFSFLPVFSFSAISLIPAVSAFLAASSAAYTLSLVFFQSWSAAILGAGLSIASGVRIERTLLVGLAVLYATMVVMLIQGKII